MTKRLPYLLLTMVVSVGNSPPSVAAFMTTADGGSRLDQSTLSRTWIERPWILKYALMVSTGGGYQSAVRNDLRERQKAAPYADLGLMRWQGIIGPTRNISTDWTDPLTVVVIEFDREGRVITPHTFARPLRGRLNQNLDIALSPGDDPKDPIFLLGAWSQGFGSGSEHWAPGLCQESEMRGPGDDKSHLYRYGAKFDSHDYVGGFGCREWTYQLRDDDRPYIDVTSYQPKPAKGSKTPKADHAILDFTGWARFGDHKPVIGLHHGTWYCLLDCPRGEVPGPIENIRRWSANNGWKAPVPPTQLPLFPDRRVAPDSPIED